MFQDAAGRRVTGRGSRGARRALEKSYRGRCAPLGVEAGWQCCGCRAWGAESAEVCVCGHHRCDERPPADVLEAAAARDRSGRLVLFEAGERVALSKARTAVVGALPPGSTFSHGGARYRKVSAAEEEI